MELAIAGLYHWEDSSFPRIRRIYAKNEYPANGGPADKPVFWVVLTNRSKEPIKIWTGFTDYAIRFHFKDEDGELVSITAKPIISGMRAPIYKRELNPGEPWVFPIKFRDRFWKGIPRGHTKGQIQAVFTIHSIAAKYWSGTVKSPYVKCEIEAEEQEETIETPGFEQLKPEKRRE
jgi:hypothetical protein